MPYTPTFEEIFPKVRRLLIRTHQALEEAIPKSKEFFETENRDIDRYLFPNLVRYYMKHFLEKVGYSVENDEDEESNVEYQFQRLVNNGLSGIFNGFRFRILKAAENGELPIPGLSERKQLYYNQQLYLPFYRPNELVGQHIRPNLIILWEIDSNTDFLQQRLACPKSGGKTKDSVQAYFNEPIPHGVELVKGKVSEETEEEIQVTRKENNTVKEHKD